MRAAATVLGTVVLVVAACGGGDGSTTTDPATGADDDTTPTTAAAAGEDGQSDDAGEETGTDDAASSGERMATITIDGETTTFDLDDLTYSPVEGVEDVTFETCSPDFFGSGRFYAIGYAVDDAGEIIVDADGQPGQFNMDLPPDDWEATQRDEPTFEIRLGDLDIEIASPEEAAGGTMAWTIDETTASGSAVFVDFETTYTVEFEIVCEGSPTVSADDLPSDDDDGAGEGGGGLPLADAGTGSFTADGESFDDVDVFRCEPFSFGGDPDPRDVSLLGYLGGSSGLEVEVGHSQGFDLSDGSQFDQIDLAVFYSRSGESGLEQFEGSARNRADDTWYWFSRETGEEIDLAEPPVVIEDDRVVGQLAGLEQTWPDEGAATVDVTFDFEIPTEVNPEC